MQHVDDDTSIEEIEAMIAKARNGEVGDEGEREECPDPWQLAVETCNVLCPAA